jgi:hypothetical protein
MKTMSKYLNLDEATVATGRVANLLKSKFDAPVKKVEEKRKITFTLAKGIDEQEFENFDKIDNIIAFLEKTFKGSIVKHDYDKFTVEEL